MKTHSPRYKKIVINSWERFKATVGSPLYRSWAFRGQSDSNWPLNSSLTRYLYSFGIHKKAWSRQEDRILRIFRRKAHLYLQHIPDADDSFQWLALMQHHGAPTRLLDFTWSSYVAAFFALEHATTDAAIWAIFPPNISSHRRTQEIRSSQIVEPLKMGPWYRGNYEKYFLPGDMPFVVVGEPQVMNRRLIAQSGTFVMPGVLDEPIESILNDYPVPKETIIKFILRTGKMREEAMRELYLMNITHATLFPDLDGLARSMAYELEFHWAFNTRTMKVYPGFEEE